MTTKRWARLISATGYGTVLADYSQAAKLSLVKIATVTMS
jgi:hypothetical protein